MFESPWARSESLVEGLASKWHVSKRQITTNGFTRVGRASSLHEVCAAVLGFRLRDVTKSHFSKAVPTVCAGGWKRSSKFPSRPDHGNNVFAGLRSLAM